MKTKTLHHFIPPTLLLGLSAFLSSVLGVIRDRLLARTFGASDGEGIYNLDAYYAAFKIPDLLYFILIAGAISSAFIPIFTQYKKAGHFKKAWEFASNMLHLMLLFVSLIALVAFIFAPQLTSLVAQGFEPEAFQLTVRLMRIMLLSPILLTFSAIFISLQDSFKTFFFRSLFPLIYNLGIIFGIVFFAPHHGVLGVTWGVILGAFLAVLLQLPALAQIEYRHFWLLDFKKSDVRQALAMMLPRVLSTGMYQFTQVFYTLIASFLATGSITVLYFANNLYSLPLSIVAVSFSITSFATLSELATDPDFRAFGKEVKRVMHQILFLILPATVGMILLREPLIQTLLLTGKFTAQDAALTSQVLLIMLLSLFTHSLNLLLMRGFFAQHDTRTPFLATVLGAFIGLILAYWLSMLYGVLGVAIGMTVSNLLTFLILYIWMNRRISQPILEGFYIFKLLVASLFMGVVVYFFIFLIPFPQRLWMELVYLIFIALAGFISYFFLVYFLGVQHEFSLKLKKKKNS